RWTHVVRHDDLVDHALGPQHSHKRGPECPRDVLVDLIRNRAPHVVGLDEPAQIPLWLRHEQQLTGSHRQPEPRPYPGPVQYGPIWSSTRRAATRPVSACRPAARGPDSSAPCLPEIAYRLPMSRATKG